MNGDCKINGDTMFLQSSSYRLHSQSISEVIGFVIEVGLRVLEWVSPMDTIGNVISADILSKAIGESVDVTSTPIVAVITER